MAIVSILLAALLPLAPAPTAPFPKIITDAPVITDVAPGVRYGDYEMLTTDGPLSVHVVAVDLNEPSVRVGTVLANDRLVSPGETVSSMASRTGAVAGINGDYFDINQTNQPLNILVQNGRLIRAPMQRWAIAFTPQKNVTFQEFHFGAQATLPSGTIDLKTMNDWPPPGDGAVFVTPEYGTLRPEENVTDIALTPVSGTPPFATYRVTSIADNTTPQPPGYYLAIGMNSYGQADPPNAGDAVTITDTNNEQMDGVVSAIGGGPLLVKDGAWYADPDGPSKGEFATHMPATGAALTRDGTLLLFEIDGRQPALSIGVLQPQFAALMIAFGAQTGMQFDGGGSSTIVARLPGETAAQVLNSPSDGQERHVGDGLFIYSDAPNGPVARLYSRPQQILAFPGADVPIETAVTDYAGHAVSCNCTTQMSVEPASAGSIDQGVFTAGTRLGDATVRIQAGSLHLDIPVRVTRSAARVDILPEHPAVLAHDTLQMQAHAFDERGYPIALPDLLPWDARGASIDSQGFFRAGDRDAAVDVRLGDRVFSQTVTVGEHIFDLSLQKAAFSTAPRGGPGELTNGEGCTNCIELHYDFTGDERAAYADDEIRLPQRALALSAEVYGDGNGEILRAAVNNAINERFLYTIAKVDWHGWRHVELHFPAALPQPITLKSLYVINRVGPGSAVNAAGQIEISAVRAVLAGSDGSTPK